MKQLLSAFYWISYNQFFAFHELIQSSFREYIFFNFKLKKTRFTVTIEHNVNSIIFDEGGLDVWNLFG